MKKAAVLLVLLVACSSSGTTNLKSRKPTSTIDPFAKTGGYSLPKKMLTPGATDPRVTQDNIHQTICIAGYTKTVRPAVSYTQKLKKLQVAQYGYQDTNLSDFEEDHLIPLELAGSPQDPKNLWPEPHSGGSDLKDALENYLHNRICRGRIQLADAQTRIADDWYLYWVAVGKPMPKRTVPFFKGGNP